LMVGPIESTCVIHPSKLCLDLIVRIVDWCRWHTWRHAPDVVTNQLVVARWCTTGFADCPIRATPRWCDEWLWVELITPWYYLATIRSKCGLCSGYCYVCVVHCSWLTVCDNWGAPCGLSPCRYGLSHANLLGRAASLILVHWISQQRPS